MHASRFVNSSQKLSPYSWYERKKDSVNLNSGFFLCPLPVSCDILHVDFPCRLHHVCYSPSWVPSHRDTVQQHHHPACSREEEAGSSQQGQACRSHPLYQTSSCPPGIQPQPPPSTRQAQGVKRGDLCDGPFLIFQYLYWNKHLTLAFSLFIYIFYCSLCLSLVKFAWNLW